MIDIKQHLIDTYCKCYDLNSDEAKQLLFGVADMDTELRKKARKIGFTFDGSYNKHVQKAFSITEFVIVRGIAETDKNAIAIGEKIIEKK